MWGYYCGYTAAQIELMIADGPVIVYKRDKKDKDKKKKPSSVSLERAALEWEREYGEGGNNKITVNLGGNIEQ